MAHTKKVALTGHTRGIGADLVTRLEEMGCEVKGFSKSNGYNIMKESTCKRIVKESLEWGADIFVNNAYSPGSQVRLLYLFYEAWENKPRQIINLGAISSDSIHNFSQMGFNKDWTPYVSDKARLDWASLQLSNQWIKGKCRVTMIKPGFVDTDSTAWLKGIAEDIMMTPDSVAEMIEWIVSLKNDVQVRNLSFDVGNFDASMKSNG